MADLNVPYWAVRKTRYGKQAFDVVEVVAVTAKTHSYREQGFRGEWGRATRQNDAPKYAATFASYTDACQAAQRGNAEWDAHGDAIAEAQARTSRLIEQRRDKAVAAINRARTGEGG